MYIISILAVVIISKYLTTGSSGVFFPFNFTIVVMLLFDITLLAGAGFLKDFNNAFRLAIRRKNREESAGELERAIEAVRLTRKLTLATGIFFLFFEAVQILVTMDFSEVWSGSGTELGEMMVSGLAAPLYSAAIILVLLPMESALRLKLWSVREMEKPEAGESLI